MKPWLLKRQELSHVKLIRELQDILEDWKNYLCMNNKTYLDLLERITPLLKKQDTVMRSAITPHERLAATLRFLIIGGSLEDLKFSTCMSAQSLGRVNLYFSLGLGTSWTLLVCSPLGLSGTQALYNTTVAANTRYVGQHLNAWNP